MTLTRYSTDTKPLSQKEVTRLIQLYTPTGFLMEYERTGSFVLPYSIDSMLTPPVEIVNNPEYHYYQKLIWDLQNEKATIIVGDNKSFLRELYRFLSYKWYFDAVYNEIINRPVLKIAYSTLFRLLDKGILELFGPYGISSNLFSSANKMKRLQIGEVYYYAYLMTMFIVISIIALNYTVYI